MGLGRLLGAGRWIVGWLRVRDPGFAALRRAGRAAIVMPGMFAIGDRAIGNPSVATFAAFGSFSTLLLVDFTGPMRNRLRSQAALVVTGAVLVCLATLASQYAALATLAMVLVGFVVLFAGVVSSVLARSTTSLLLAFILPVCLGAPIATIPDELAGWGMAGGASLLAIALLWPAPSRDPLRGEAVATLRALVDRLRGDIAYVDAEESPQAQAAHAEVVARADGAIAHLEGVFFATPFRPAGLSAGERMILRLVEELRWLALIATKSTPRHGMAINQLVCHVRSAAAGVLEKCANALATPGPGTGELAARIDALRAALDELEAGATAELPGRDRATATDAAIGEFMSALDPSFRAQELGFVVSQIASNVALAAAADRRAWMARVLGRGELSGVVPGVLGTRLRDSVTTIAVAQERAGSYLQRHSVWLQNSVRGAIALGVAVLVAREVGATHAFWVVFAALSVLRSNASATGQSVLRALAGTAVGFVVGGALVQLVGADTTVLWVLLPFAVLFAGLAPAAISFLAGQAAFTLTLVILFNIVAPVGWKVGIARIEDVALACAISLVVGALFWPRGATSALGRALGDAYAEAARYLAAAVEFGLGVCDAGTPTRPAPAQEGLRAVGAGRRLDDAMRGYLAERGTKSLSLATVSALVTGASGVRLAGDSVLDLWQRDTSARRDRAGARAEIQARSVQIADWYASFAAALSAHGELPAPMVHDTDLDLRLVDAIRRDLRDADGAATATAARLIWTRDHLDAAGRFQVGLVDAARDGEARRSPGASGRLARIARRLRSQPPALTSGERAAKPQAPAQML